MLEIVEGLPPNVLGIVVKGRVMMHDYTEVLGPALKQAREWNNKLRLYYEIRSRYPGATWQELNLGSLPGVEWERVAIVSDVAFVKYTVRALKLLIPGDIRVFPTSQTSESLAWVCESGMRTPAWATPAANSPHSIDRTLRPSQQFLYPAP